MFCSSKQHVVTAESCPDFIEIVLSLLLYTPLTFCELRFRTLQVITVSYKRVFTEKVTVTELLKIHRHAIISRQNTVYLYSICTQ